MLTRLARLFAALGLLAALWGLNAMREPGDLSWVRAVGAGSGTVRILQFYASVGTLTRGQKALLCYGVVNAKSVRISPMLPDVYPSARRCVAIVPEHTTHYTLLAEGFDGHIATQSLTLAVLSIPEPPRLVHYAGGTGCRPSRPDGRPEPIRAYSTAAGSALPSSEPSSRS
jgi:hypothetical protein